jgi:type II secretory ATPase GspE/PulE/Tfp pilus assembly ATPase PilB-like protein
MSDLSQPSTSAAQAAAPWRWPTPPYAGYPAGESPLGAACEIEGLTSAAIGATLLAMDFCAGLIRVRVHATRSEMSLRLAQLRRITLTAPIAAQKPAVGDPHASMLAPPAAVEYRLRLAHGGGALTGKSVGHVAAEHGVFLFPPIDDSGRVLRVFVPKSSYADFEIGPRIGEVLVEQLAVTPEQVQQAVAEQAALRTRKLGELLLAQRIVEPAQLLEAIDQQARMPVVRIGEALVALNLITTAQLTHALEQQKSERSIPLGELLVRAGHVSRHDLQHALARKMGYPVIDTAAFPVEPDAVRALPYNIARRLQVMPLLLRGGQLVVAMADPSRRADVDEIEFVTQLKLVPALAPADALPAAIATTYQRFGDDPWANNIPLTLEETIPFEAVDASKLLETLEQQHHNAQRDHGDEQAIEQSDNSLVRLVHTMIVDAQAQGISDIHVETMPGREKVRIRFRKDGVLKPYLELPHTYRAAIVARIKIMCDLDISERRKPQDGKIAFAKFSAQHKLELRVATIPTANGLEDVVLRLLANARALPMDQIGLSGGEHGNYRRLKAAIERPYGMVLCVGPTGSGKTTTLHSALAHLNTAQRKIWTAEDPVEITQAGLRQVQVNPKIEWTFAKALRSFLRADPDVIMVGEIRDRETAQTAVEASLTGHLVMSTLHTNSAPETVTRLLDMGLDPFNFGDSLLAVLAQRLVRRLCPHCRAARNATGDEVDELLHDWLHVFAQEGAPAKDQVLAAWRAQHGPQLMHWESKGCASCEGSGLRGRAALHELMTVTRELRRLIQTGARAEQLQQQAMADGMCTLRQDGIDKVLAGVTSIGEVRATANG